MALTTNTFRSPLDAYTQFGGNGISAEVTFVLYPNASFQYGATSLAQYPLTTKFVTGKGIIKNIFIRNLPISGAYPTLRVDDNIILEQADFTSRGNVLNLGDISYTDIAKSSILSNNVKYIMRRNTNNDNTDFCWMNANLPFKDGISFCFTTRYRWNCTAPTLTIEYIQDV